MKIPKKLINWYQQGVITLSTLTDIVHRNRIVELYAFVQDEQNKLLNPKPPSITKSRKPPKNKSAPACEICNYTPALRRANGKILCDECQEKMR